MTPVRSVGWDAVAATYAETFAPLCAGVVPFLLEALGRDDRAGSAAGHPFGRLLDVGTGTGSLAAAGAAYATEVCALDPDPAMLRFARTALATATPPATAPPPTALAVAALPRLPVRDGGFDTVAASFVLNHVPDPRRAAAELARATRPGGRVAVTIWPSGHNVQSRLWAAVIEESGAVAPPGTRLPEDLDFPRTIEGLTGLLEGAGLREVTDRSIRWTHRTDPDALWRGACAGVGAIGVTVTSQPDGVRQRMHAAYRRLSRPLLEDGRMRLDTEAVLAVGRR